MVAKGLEPLTRVAAVAGLGLFINVKNAPYSAVGDGVADDSAAFQAVLDLFKYSSGTRGGRIIVPAGIYNIRTPLVYEGDFGHSFVMQGDTQGEAQIGDGPVLRYVGKTFTADAGTDVITSTAHSYSADQAVVVSSTGTLPAPLVAAGTTYYVRDVTANTFKLAATLGGAAIDLTTAGTGTHSISIAGVSLLTLKGANFCNFEHIQFHGNGLALIDVDVQYDSARALPSFDCTWRHCGFSGATGVDSMCMRWGTSNFASAEHRALDCRFIYHPNPGDTYYGIGTTGSANTKNHVVKRCRFLGFRWALSFSNSGYHKVDGCSFANQTIADIKVSNTQVSVRDSGSESSAKFIDRAGVSVTGSLLIESSYWHGTTVGDNYIIDYDGQLTIINSDFFNDKTPTLRTFTVDTGTNVFTSTAHGFKEGTRVNVSTTGTLPAPLAAATNYYARDTTTDTFKLSTTEGGTAIDITTAGSGTNSVFLPTEPAIKSGLLTTGSAIRGSVVSLNNLFQRQSGSTLMDFIPVYDGSNQNVSSAYIGSSFDGFSDPTSLRGVQLLSFGDKSKKSDSDVDINFPPRMPGHLTYVSAISAGATRGKNLRGSVTFSSSDTVSVTFPAAEPDALYFIAISGNAAEAFWVTSKSTTGFTVRSSNPTSTASVDWIIVK